MPLEQEEAARSTDAAKATARELRRAKRKEKDELVTKWPAKRRRRNMLASFGVGALEAGRLEKLRK